MLRCATGSTSPVMWAGQVAKYRMCSAASFTSTRFASLTGLPLSSDSSSASSSAFASMASASASIALVRAAAEIPVQRPSSNASRAARTARSTSSEPA